MSLSKTIKFMRLYNNLTQEEVSVALNISQNAYGNIERGDTNLTVSKLKQISSLFGLKITELIEISENNIIESFDEVEKTKIDLMIKKKLVDENILSKKKEENENLNKLVQITNLQIAHLKKINNFLENDCFDYFLIDIGFRKNLVKKSIKLTNYLHDKIQERNNISVNAEFLIIIIEMNLIKNKNNSLFTTSIQSQFKKLINEQFPNIEISIEDESNFIFLWLDFNGNYKIKTILKYIKNLLEFSCNFENDQYILIDANIGIYRYPHDGLTSNEISDCNKCKYISDE